VGKTRWGKNVFLDWLSLQFGLVPSGSGKHPLDVGAHLGLFGDLYPMKKSLLALFTNTVRRSCS
jgi:hypothetical protein